LLAYEARLHADGPRVVCLSRGKTTPEQDLRHAKGLPAGTCCVLIFVGRPSS
jgi:hypothetical protein